MEKIKSTIDHSKPVIEIRDVSKSFGDNHVLRGVNLDLYKEENLVVLGRRFRR
jgi:phospholipid/cholesterol/gamma-HCH transport system ATP-binding protein